MSVSLCVLRIEIDEDLPEMGDNPADGEAAKEQKKKDRGERESKAITVETYASVLGGQNTEVGILPTSSRKSTPDEETDEETINFYFGNPMLEVTKGVLHLYKENELRESVEAKTICLLSVPGSLGATDLLAFAAACQQDIAHVRILRDGSPDHYMALFTFRTCQAAREFHETFDGVPYSSLEPHALCHTAWVSRAEWGRHGAAPPSHTELPTCPVCLERMDESVFGVLSVQCAHAFHAACLVRWRDARCPVCRCAQVPEPRAPALCSQCQEQEEEEGAGGEGEGEGEGREPRSAGGEGEGEGEGREGAEGPSLWICLICGHVGCGRYEGGHAAKHFLASNHTYAMQLGSNRVWDYAGDNFVHRLVQNKPDGKLVAWGAAGGGEKLEALEQAQLQLCYQLTDQLQRQRDHFQRRLLQLEETHETEVDQLNARAQEAETKAADLKEQVTTLTKENKALERKLHQVTNKLSTIQSELSEERGLATALANNQAEWQAAARQREDKFNKEVAELKEQLRDVMFFVEARNQLEKADVAADEIQAASVSVAPPTKPRRKRH